MNYECRAELAFDFFITGNTGSFGNNFGTVSGTIYGLQDNTVNQLPTSVVINSVPAGVSLSYGTEVMNWDSAITGEFFNVINGQITDARFERRSSSDAFNTVNAQYLSFINFQDRALFREVVDFNTSTWETLVDENFFSQGDGITSGFSDGYSAAVPEPTSLVMFGIAMIGYCRRRRSIPIRR